MMHHPLKLRLRVVLPENLDDGVTYITTGVRWGYHSENEYYSGPAILEFENPLNGTWHPVEVVQDTETEKPA
jgi:hypothetical protein